MEEVKPGWYLNTQTGLQQYWDGTQWLEIPAPTHIDGQPVVTQKSEVADIAIIALVFSFAVPFVGWFLGFKARKEISDSQGKKSGAPLATAAIWVGGVATVALALMIAFCTIASTSFDDRFGHRGFMNHKMYLGDNTFSYGYGYGAGPGDLNGRIPMMGSGSAGSSSGTVTIDPNGGMMFGGQGDEAVPSTPQSGSDFSNS